MATISSKPHSKSSAGSLPMEHPAVAWGRIGVLLVNLGTPEATDYWSVRRYLAEFLSDRRVIEMPRILWWPLLHGLILTTRPKRSGHAYSQIWDKKNNCSPLKTIGKNQAERLAKRLSKRDVIIDWAMRYGHPAIAPAIDRLRARGCDRICLVPMYPQYSATTTASVCDRAFDHMKKLRWQPALRIAPAWHDDPVYIQALAKSTRQSLARLKWRPDFILASFHGLPRVNLGKGDPYHCHCVKTARLLQKALKLDDQFFGYAFQSRFGPSAWLGPYTSDRLQELAQAGMTKVAVITPGFVSDCVETLEEIAIGERANFLGHGGENFTAIPCLNATPAGIDVLHHIVRRELAGWI